METIKDIVADIRAQNQGLPEDGYALSPYVHDLLRLADRIEAAHERELADALDTGAFVEATRTRKDSLQVGNAAKMRESVRNIIGYAAAAKCHTEDAHILGYLDQITQWARSLKMVVAEAETTTSADGASPRPWFVNGHSIEANDKSLWLQNEKTGRGVVALLPSAPKWRFKKEQRAKMDALAAANAKLIMDAVNGGLVVSKMETTTDENSVVGDNAKMRGALVRIRQRVIDAITKQAWSREDAEAICNIAEAALAAPPRNCDRFNNADELVAYYGDDALKEAWRELREMIKNGKYEFAIDLVFMIDWLFAEAKGANDEQ